MIILTTLPLWAFAMLLVVLTVLAMTGPILMRRRFGLEWLRTNNEVAGVKFGTIGTLYAVLLAFAIVVVWQKFDDADNAVAREAGAARPPSIACPMVSAIRPAPRCAAR
jgi:hypothetical protein